MEEDSKQPDGTEWPVIGENERILYEILFYSQGPVDGYLLGEGVRDLFLKSGLSLRVLSQIWNLADVSNDNVLNVHEFVLVMHLIRGLLQGLKAPLTLPRKLTPPKTPPITLPSVTAQEKEAYGQIFKTLGGQETGYLDGDCCRHVFEASGLTSEVLAKVWNLSDVTRDGVLGVEEFCVACHLLRFIKAGHNIDGPVDVFTMLPDKVDSQSLQARKRRVQQYEQHKQKLMSLKEKRRSQVVQENKRLQLQQEKLDLVRQAYKVQKKTGRPQITDEQFSANVAKEKEEIERLEEIVYRLKKQHEKVRQETVRIILAEQKLNSDIVTIKKDTDELNKRLGTCHTHATKDPDPFHQLYEQRKEKRQGSTIKDLDKIDVSLPFTFNPFDPRLPAQSVAQGAQLFASTGNNHSSRGSNLKAVTEGLGGFGEGFVSLLEACSVNDPAVEEDAVFKEVSVSMEEDRWLGLQWGGEGEEGVLGLNGPQTQELQEKLWCLKAELKKLNEPGSRLLFKNPDDYLARKRAQEEEEKDKNRFQRRSVTDRRSGVLDSPRGRGSADSASPRLRDRGPRDRHSYTERNDEVSQVVREYRQKRQSLHSQDSSLSASAASSASSSPKESHQQRNSRASRSPPSESSAELSPRDDLSTAAAVVAAVSRERAEVPSVRSDGGQLTSCSTSVSSPQADTAQPTTVVSADQGQALSSLATVPTPVSTVSQGPEPVTPTVTVTGGKVESQHVINVEGRQNQCNGQLDKREVDGGRTVPAEQVISAEKQAHAASVLPSSTDNQIKNTVRQTEAVQSPKVPGSAQGISTNRSSSKKTRAPPPPPAGCAVKPSSKDGSSRVSTTSSQQALPSAKATSCAGQPESVPPPQPQLKQSAAPQPAQGPSPERPARPKRRKDSRNSVSSNPSSPQDAPQQPLFQGNRLSGTADNFRLSENAALEEEAPPVGGTVIITTKTTAKVVSSDKLPSQKASAKDPLRPQLVLNNSSQGTGVSSTVTSTDPIKPKRRKGKAPEPPSSSPNSSPRDIQLSSSTPSPSNSPRDAPLLPIPKEQFPYACVSKAEDKTEKTKSAKTKAPPPPEASHPKPAPHVPHDILKQPQEPQKELPVFSAPKLEPKEAPLVISTDTTTVVTSLHQVPKLSLSEQSPEPVIAIVEKEAIKELYPEKTDIDRGRTSETSSAYDSDADSLPPPLPSSAPPPLPSSPPPTEPQNSLSEQVIEVCQMSSTSTLLPTQKDQAMEEVDFRSMLPDTLPDSSEDPQKSIAKLRAQFFGLNTSSDNSSNGRLLDMDFDDVEVKARRKDDVSDDSDLSSDEHNLEGTFSPGDSGVIMSSLPTSPDDADSRIQLLSYTSTTPSLSAHQDHITLSTTTTSTTNSLRPQSLPMKERGSVHSGDALSPNSVGTLSSQDLDTLSPRSREIFEKARHFAEMVNKPSFVAKREKGEEVKEDFSQETLQDLEMERRAVISQSTVRKKDVKEPMSPPPPLVTASATVNFTFSEVKEQAVAGEQRLGSQGEEAYSPETTEGPNVRWTEKSGKVNLYSENVVKEPVSTDVVDRESIANLATTRRQWEAIFTTDLKEDANPKPKKTAPKWEVRMPYAEKAPVGIPIVSCNNSAEPESPPPAQISGMADSESAIEREIRLAMEREEMLKREQEERLRQAAQQSQHSRQTSSMESSTESELQPTFHELTEADRGSEFFIHDRLVQQENAEQEEALQQRHSYQKFGSNNRNEDNGTESIIEREIRLQREREAELAQQREGRVLLPPVVTTNHSSPRSSSPELVVELQEQEDVQNIPYEEAISHYNHEGESRIAQELRELREREEEVHRLRERISKASVSGGGKEASLNRSPAMSSPAPAKQLPKATSAPQTLGGNKSAPSTPRSDRAPVVNFSRSIHGSPRLDTTASPKANASPKPETPIEREIRLARERENELRRAKGLPELQPDPPRQDSVEEADPDMVLTPRHYVQQPDTSMRRFASNRLQQEMQDQHNREMKLRQEGKIISTSEEHIQPLRYTEVVGQDRVDGAGKRNFKAPSRLSSNASHEEVTSGDSPRSQPAPSTPRDGVATKKATGGGAPSFSYREFAQTAESKIERELREMREREEELRKQRTGEMDS